MFYDQSEQILELIKESKNILINTHKNPDYDSIASSLALSQAIKEMGKKTKILACQEINKYFYFLKGAEEIENVDYSKFDFSPFDLFIIVDTGSFDRVTGDKSIKLPENVKYFVIDHHKTNNFSYPKLIDEQASATCEVLCGIFSDWGVNINKELATYLLTGILGDTVFLRYSENNEKTMEVVNRLVKLGADKDYISENFYEKYDFNIVKLLGQFLSNMKREDSSDGGFVWSALPYKIYEQYGKPEGVREMAADMFFRGIKDTSFGVAILETKEGEINLSFRSKKNTDVSKYAKLFGGGGHKNAAGVVVYGSFEKVISDIIDKLKTI